MDTKRLCLIRHGITDTVLNREVSGSSDPPLNEAGRKQMQRLISRLDQADPEVIFSSPLVRAKESAEILSSHFGCHIIELTELREIDMGDWDGRLHTPRNGESIEMLCERVSTILSKIMCDLQNEAVVCCVTHGGPIRATLINALDIPLENYWKILIPHGSVSIFEYYDNQLVPSSIGQI
jgi:broad specificity phosphatase PhoE